MASSLEKTEGREEECRIPDDANKLLNWSTLGLCIKAGRTLTTSFDQLDALVTVAAVRALLHYLLVCAKPWVAIIPDPWGNPVCEHHDVPTRLSVLKL